MMMEPKNKEKIRAGNATMRAAARLAQLRLHFLIPCFMENLHSSMAWQHRLMQRVLRHPNTTVHVVDYCVFGTPWRKRTLLAGLTTGFHQQLNQKCAGKRGVCQTGKPHVHIKGSLPGVGQVSRAAETYPRGLAARGAKALIDSAERRHLHRLQALAK